ncbi:uncharacterized protein LOC129584519 [Paramacrobiotus metropolitanus]|uniref:uncharacterized protein LOC129584519 n=1 Tax=Paramacrobiotus metropolitanus TaxID=2943436 RepID=UPI002445CEB6|nr:uncharacterized protein LOC129584519 [Paramacrobiotus metropolitanus]
METNTIMLRLGFVCLFFCQNVLSEYISGNDKSLQSDMTMKSSNGGSYGGGLPVGGSDARYGAGVQQVYNSFGGRQPWAIPGGGNVNVYDYLGITSILPYYGAMWGEMNAFARNPDGMGFIAQPVIPDHEFYTGRLTPVFGGFGGYLRRRR